MTDLTTLTALIEPEAKALGLDLVRVHALDSEGLRMFDTLECGFRVSGSTREWGSLRIERSWSRGENES